MSLPFSALLKSGEQTLLPVSGTDAAFEAAELLLFAADMDRTKLLLRKNEEADDGLVAAYRDLLSRRTAGEPLQYILGVWEFCGFSYAVGSGVLIPRPETEELTFLAAEQIKKRGVKTVYDLCAGSGCIGITLARLCPGVRVFCIEKYPAALSFLHRNIPKELTDRVFPVEADVLLSPPDGLPAPECIVSNPPYIESAVVPTLSREVRKEPHSALDGGADGLTFYRAILKNWVPLLPSGGLAAFECGEKQTAALSALFACAGTCDVRRDLYGKDRFILLLKS